MYVHTLRFNPPHTVQGFEDCLVLDEILSRHTDSIRKFVHHVNTRVCAAAALDAYSAHRCIDAHAICDLAMYNYLEVCTTLWP